MPKQYAAEFRLHACEQMLLGIGFSTLYRWRRRALVDPGTAPGTRRVEADELTRARCRIKELEGELALVKAATALFEEVSRDQEARTRW